LLPTPPHDDAVTFSYEAATDFGMDLHHADKAPSRGALIPAKAAIHTTKWIPTFERVNKSRHFQKTFVIPAEAGIHADTETIYGG